MKRARLGNLKFLVAAGVLTILISACGSSSASTDPNRSGLEKKNITVAALPIVDTVGFFIAQKEGFFKQEGLNITVKPVVRSTPAISAMLSGSADIIAGGKPSSGRLRKARCLPTATAHSWRRHCRPTAR